MRRLAIGIAFAVAVTTVDAQDRRASGERQETAHLVVTTSTAAAAVGKVSLIVNVTPKPGMHVYSPEQKDVIPISLKLDAGEFKAQPAVLPKPEKYLFKPLNETQLVYSKPFRIVQNVTLAAAAAKGSGGTTITGTLQYQACDDSICYVPVTVRLAWPVKSSLP